MKVCSDENMQEGLMLFRFVFLSLDIFPSFGTSSVAWASLSFGVLICKLGVGTSVLWGRCEILTRNSHAYRRPKKKVKSSLFLKCSLLLVNLCPIHTP